MGLVLHDSESLRQFVETYHDYKKEKFELREVFSRFDSIREHVHRTLRDIIYHDLPKVAGIYGEACGIELTDFGNLMQSIFIRHDIVHRNGKTKDGTAHTISSEQLENLCVAVETFVDKVAEQVRKALANKGNPSGDVK